MCAAGECRIAIEGKYKIDGDGAVPDNRKAAFFDLFKLARYVASGQYCAGLFLWLTNVPEYLRKATGDSTDFSTHDGRLYRAGTALMAARARNAMPLPLVLTQDFRFDWQSVAGSDQWHALALCVG